MMCIYVSPPAPDQTGTAPRYKKLPLLVQDSIPDSSDRSKLLLTEANISNANMIFTLPQHQIEHLLPLERLLTRTDNCVKLPRVVKFTHTFSSQ